jgi:hypothetical protein
VKGAQTSVCVLIYEIGGVIKKNHSIENESAKLRVFLDF